MRGILFIALLAPVLGGCYLSTGSLGLTPQAPDSTRRLVINGQPLPTDCEKAQANGEWKRACPAPTVLVEVIHQPGQQPLVLAHAERRTR